MKSVQSSHESRYRSVKYRLNRDISVPTNQISSDKVIYFPSTAKNSAFRSKRKSHKFSITNVGQFRSSQMNPQTLQKQDDKLKSSTYMDTFHFLVNMQKNKYNAKQKERYEKQKIQKQKAIDSEISSSFKLSRVILPTLNQLQSNFTVLDNVNLPISYINQQITRISKQMNDEVPKIKKIAHQLRQIQRKTLQELDQTSKKGLKGFQTLRGLLKANKVYQQQQVLKIKNAIQRTKQYLPNFYTQLDQGKQKVKELQDQIFKGMPFQLEQLPQFQVLSSKYF